ncbi:DNA-binding response regulator (plasmid) [Paraburkholderia sp. PGU19]|uniref:response regulator transcription factor n=1 Tax=Paraburkholderia sp. PGU19 TaxID=2735434 RepID=UPI0015DA9DA8|nr:response regulator [Paraburkholderia sp. PGU19]BCG02553.1 DNA-binding response regulator [Paraburkholderia sp. PGU19]
MDSFSLIYVVDDDISVRESIADLLATVGLEVRLFTSASEMLDAFVTPSDKSTVSPSCIILDIRMPGVGGLEAQERLAKLQVYIPIVFMTAHGDIAMTVKAMKSGAHNFLSKPFRDQDLLDAVRSAMMHDRTRRETERGRRELRERYESLTAHERKLLSMVTGGLMNKQIAAKMNLSEITIKVHRGQLMRKMKANTLVELVKMETRLPKSDQ